jgi:hypothetical protein
VREQDETDGRSVPGGLPSALVVGLDVREAEAAPGGAGRIVDLEQPEPEPASAECVRSELAQERLLLHAERRPVSPARRVQAKEGVEVCVESVAIRKSVGRVVPLEELPLERAHLVAEVAAPRGEQVLPAGSTDDRTSLSPEDARTGPIVAAGELLADEDVPTLALQQPAQSADRGRAVRRRANRP